MKPHYQIEVLHILWNLYSETEYLSPDGRTIEVLQHGEYDEKKHCFSNARIRCGDETYHGEIVIWGGDEMPPGNFENTILHVTPFPSASILRNDGQPVMQVIDTPDPVCSAAYEELKAGLGEARCSRHTAALGTHERIALFTRLMVDRLYGKYREVMEVYRESDQNWTEAAYAMLLRAMGKPYNTEQFGELARRVAFKVICKERSSIENVEALLLGGSGLLEMYDDDKYILELKKTFEHQCHKYGIVPMRPGQWNLGKNNTMGIPVLRIAQLANFFTANDFIFDNILKCNTIHEAQRYFDTEASVYWSTHFKPGEKSISRLKKLGADKANTMAINFIVPMQFAYGISMSDESLKEKALDLLEKINPESNKIIEAWKMMGTLPENAFDSQAILQINKEYCVKGLCWLCPVGRRVIKEVYRGLSA